MRAREVFQRRDANLPQHDGTANGTANGLCILSRTDGSRWDFFDDALSETVVSVLPYSGIHARVVAGRSSFPRPISRSLSMLRLSPPITRRSAWVGATHGKHTCLWLITSGLFYLESPSALTSSRASVGRRRKTTEKPCRSWSSCATTRLLSFIY